MAGAGGGAGGAVGEGAARAGSSRRNLLPASLSGKRLRPGAGTSAGGGAGESEEGVGGGGDGASARGEGLRAVGSAVLEDDRAARLLGAPKTFGEGDTWGALRLKRQLSSPNLAALDFTCRVKPESRAKNFRPFAKEYLLKETLGTGGYAVVRRGVHQRSGEEFAVKVMQVSAQDDPDDEMTHAEILNELKLMHQLEHPNIVRMKEYFINAGMCYVVMEWLKGQELMDHLVARGSHSEQDVKAVLRRLLDATAYMHSSAVSHRDLKLENLVLREPGNLASVTIVDFGLAKAARAREQMEDMCGTPEYAAPEVLLGRPYTPQVDLWSIGVGLHVLLSGSFPFEHSDDEELYDLITDTEPDLSGPEWRTISKEAKDLLLGLLQKNPKERLTAAEALEHAWFTGLASHTAQTLHHVHARLDKLVASTRLPRRKFDKGDWLVRQGERLHDVYLVLQGECEVIVNRMGDLENVATLRRGNFVGDIEYPTPSRRPSIREVVSQSSTPSASPIGSPADAPSYMEKARERSVSEGAFSGLGAFKDALKELDIHKGQRAAQRQKGSVRALGKVEVAVLRTEDMEWAVEHDYRLTTGLQTAMRQRRRTVAKQLRAERQAQASGTENNK